ncbi:MAG: hypothetical protein HND48_18015 [Chloroflexi bacterium]|nr:hypothetical protein [Chloroflexota bacterium]
MGRPSTDRCVGQRPSERRKAVIQQPARTKDMEALRYLEAVERADTDGSVRDLARKAIAYIKRNNPGEAEPPAADVQKSARPSFASGSILAEYGEPAGGTSARRDGRRTRRHSPNRAGCKRCPSHAKAARGAMEMAGRAAFDGLNARAAKHLVEAFKLNPNLQYDAYATGWRRPSPACIKTTRSRAVQGRLDPRSVR